MTTLSQPSPLGLSIKSDVDKKEVRDLTTAKAANVVETGKYNPVTKGPIVTFEAVHQCKQLRSNQMVSYNAFKC